MHRAIPFSSRIHSFLCALCKTGMGTEYVYVCTSRSNLRALCKQGDRRGYDLTLLPAVCMANASDCVRVGTDGSAGDVGKISSWQTCERVNYQDKQKP